MGHKGKNYRWGGPLLLLALMAGGCNTGQRLYIAEQKDMTNIRQPYQNEKKNGVDTSALKKEVTYVDNKDLHGQVATMVLDSVTGEYIATQQMDEVMVVAKSKMVPERNGKVNIDFIVRVPGKLLQTDWNMTIVPVMDNGGVITRLDSIELRGHENDAFTQRMKVYSERNARRWHKSTMNMRDRIGLVFSAKERKRQISDAFSSVENIRIKKETEGFGLRLDTVMQTEHDFYYYYTQSFPALDLKQRIRIYFYAYITNCGFDTYPLQKGDTLDYVISSMMQFLDRTPRYKRMTVQRRATESATANILFRVGDATVIDSLADNFIELDKIKNKMAELEASHEFVIDSIVLTAYCSPEGSEAANNELARQRAVALKEYLMPVISTNAEAKELLKVNWQPEDWSRTQDLIMKDANVIEKSGILNIIGTQNNLDMRESDIRRLYPADYNYIRNNIYPKVRGVDFQFHLARRNMVEEVMYTDVIDTLYSEALALMDRRMYKEAMPKLQEYEDWNTAVCYMSLGHDGSAWNILIQQPKSSDRDYLMAILAARMGKTDMAMQLYMESCRMDEDKIMRGELDPEIAQLIKQYGMDNKENK